MSIIKVSDLTYCYGRGTPFEKIALDKVSFNIEKGEFVAIIGHTGSGKSTLVSHLNGLVTPESGSVYLDGEDIFKKGYDLRSARFRVGLVFQYPEYQLFEETVYKDIAFGPKNMGLSDDEVKERVLSAAKALEIRPELLKKSPFELSGGQKRRVAIAGVIAMDRRCIIFDESTAMLDPMGRREVMKIIKKLNREDGITVILITHYMNEAAKADRIIVMNEGHIIGDGTPSEIFSSPERMWEAGLDVPQTTELLFKLKNAGLDLPLDVFDVGDCAKTISHALAKKSTSSENK